MIDPRLNQLQQALNHKADEVQREFGAVGDELQTIGRQLVNTQRVETGPLRARQAELRERQMALATQINVWRDRARAALRQRDEAAKAVAEAIRAADAQAAAHPELAAAALLAQAQARPASPAGRLLERARTESALRGDDPTLRQREAVEFANRLGLSQNDQLLTELEAALTDTDPIVADVAALALIQAHRFRAMRLNELEPAHASVRWLARLKHPAVIPVLSEILENPRTGYLPGEGGAMVEGNNRRSRLVALAALVEWRTPAAQSAVRARLYDRDPQMVAAAGRALALFPGDW